MPKVVDHEARRVQIADAALRVIAREGLHRASVRAVIAEAGLSSGAVRHYFDSHDDLLRYTGEHLNARGRRRVVEAAQAEHETSLDKAVAMCEALLPLDDARRDEIVAYSQLAALERDRLGYRQQAASALDELGAACVALLDPRRRLSSLRREVLARRAHWIVDGLAAQEVLYPHTISRESLAAGLREAMADIAAEAAERPRGA